MVSLPMRAIDSPSSKEVWVNGDTIQDDRAVAVRKYQAIDDMPNCLQKGCAS